MMGCGIRVASGEWRVASCGLRVATFALVFLASHVFAESSFDPVGDGRESLEKLGDVPWYDPQQDATGLPEKGWDFDFPRFNWNISGLGQLMVVAAWCLLAGLLALIVYLLIRYFLDRESQQSTRSASRISSTRVELVEKLPFDIDFRTNDFLGEARRRHEAGQTREAIIYLFCYQLVELDRSHRIRLTRGKTNRQYLWELRSNEALRGLVEQTMIAFEDVFFGTVTLDRHRYEVCWERLSEFQGMVRTTP